MAHDVQYLVEFGRLLQAVLRARLRDQVEGVVTHELRGQVPEELLASESAAKMMESSLDEAAEKIATNVISWMGANDE